MGNLVNAEGRWGGGLFFFRKPQTHRQSRKKIENAHGTRFETMAILVKALKCVTKRLHASHDFTFTPSFPVKSAPVNGCYKASQKANPLPENPDATSSSGLFWSAAAKPVRVNCRPPDYTARDGLHMADGAEPWCGPARRLANPCVARTSGAPSRALFHSPVPGPGHATRYSANVLWRPRFSQLPPCQ